MTPPRAATHRLYAWCLETRLPPRVAAAQVQAAGASFVAAGGARVWLLDASDVAEYDSGALAEVRSVLANLARVRLERVALVVPDPAARGVVGIMAFPVDVRRFAARAEAVAWLRAGCP